VQFVSYAAYKLGSKHFSSQVGYSSDVDLVLFRDSVSEGEDAVRRRSSSAHISAAYVLDHTARREVDETIAFHNQFERGKKTTKKYPGVAEARGRRKKNQLQNDHFANAEGKKVLEIAAADETPFNGPATTLFLDDGGYVHAEIKPYIHVTERTEQKLFKDKNVFSTPAAKAVSRFSPEGRFQRLTARQKDELYRAMHSQHLTDLINDLEKQFSGFITDAKIHGEEGPDMTFVVQTEAKHAATCRLQLNLLDSYCRLVCHCVAAFYGLLSISEGCEGYRVTIVTFPSTKQDKTYVTVPPIPGQQLLEFLSNRKRSTPKPECLRSPSPPPTFVLGSEEGNGSSPDTSPTAPQPSFKKKRGRKVRPTDRVMQNA